MDDNHWKWFDGHPMKIICLFTIKNDDSTLPRMVLGGFQVKPRFTTVKNALLWALCVYISFYGLWIFQKFFFLKFFFGNFFRHEKWPSYALSWTKRLEEICIHISAVGENGLNHSLDAILVNYVGTKPNFDHSKKNQPMSGHHFAVSPFRIKLIQTDQNWFKPNKTD